MAKTNNKISLIIPVFNEVKTITRILAAAISSGVDEIIVIDDGSVDESYKIAKLYSKNETKIKILRNKKNLGVGATRSIGIKRAAGDIVVFLDSDIQNPTAEMIRKIYEPITNGASDFSIASFDNNGRVTELVAKPLLAVCFPELPFLDQPISGQIASRKKFLFPDRIENGNAMLGIVLDAYLNGARISEVNIGQILHSKRDIEVKKKQAIAECRACIKRFIESNGFKFTISERLET